MKELNPEVQKVWKDFIEFIYSTHSLAKDCWFPDRASIEMWEEFRQSKKKVTSGYK